MDRNPRVAVLFGAAIGFAALIWLVRTPWGPIGPGVPLVPSISVAAMLLGFGIAALAYRRKGK